MNTGTTKTGFVEMYGTNMLRIYFLFLQKTAIMVILVDEEGGKSREESKTKEEFDKSETVGCHSKCVLFVFFRDLKLIIYNFNIYYL